MTALATTPAARPRGPLKRLLRPLIDPKVFDFWAARVHPIWSWERPLARIVAREAASSDAQTLRLKPNGNWAGFQVGQHINVTTDVNGRRITRSYSLCEPPRADGTVSITVKTVDGGLLSAQLCAARVGDVLEIGPAFGEMLLPEHLDAPLLFLAAGSGITPLMAMVRALAARGMPVALTLVYWARRREEFCFADELRALAAAHAGFDVRFVLTRAEAVAADESEGRIAEESLSTLLPDRVQRAVYACGPGGFVDSARALSSQSHSFQGEAFTPPPRVIEDSGSVQVTLARSGITLTVPRGQSLLTALEAEGLKPASGCRMGICNTCACGKRSGATRHLHNGDVVHEPASALKLCIHGAATDLVLEY